MSEPQHPFPHPPQPGAAQPPQGPHGGQPYGVPGEPHAAPGHSYVAPGQQSPAPGERRSWFARHKVLSTLGVLVVLGIGASALGGGDGDAPAGAAPTQPADAPLAEDVQDAQDEATQDEATQDEAAAEALPGVGATVADGKFEFVVTQVEVGVTRVGDDMFGQEAQGQFVLVHLTVTNIGDQAQYFDGSSQKALDAQGRTFSADTGAAIYLGDANSFLNQINPGNQVQGLVVFDVPVDATLTQLELHDSPFSGGVTVALA
ncbi:MULTISPECIES: DUF4352 domain-containing protein [unclassified Actinotalea]|uniref:DUF4352 domain-containing protein n=1 Tax=unclassified Actinotalea TaxID=2638618 RepID=UPI0015F5E731|nr:MULTISPECIES: DUF4352 domain-containing protein [unclassified Actinotalea]